MQVVPLTPATNEDSNRNQIIMLPTIQQSIKLATLDQAETYRDKTSLRTFDPQTGNLKKLPICSTSESRIGKYGIGLELYFFLLRHLAIFFFLVSLISIYPISSNYSGKQYGSTNQNERYTYLTLANQEGISTYETDLVKAQGKLSDIKSNLTRLWAVDFAISFLFFLFICYYIMKSRSKVMKDVGEHFKVSDFAVQIEGFPPYITKDQVIPYFIDYGEIEEVYLSRNYEGKLPFYKKIYGMAYDIEVENIVKNGRNIEKCSTLTHDINDNRVTLDKTHDELCVDKVFLVFNSLKSKKKCLKDYKTSSFRYSCFRKSNIQGTRRHAAFRLTVKSAPNPSDIIWENMEFSSFNVFRRRAVMLLLTCFIIIISFIVVFSLRGKFQSSVKQNCKGKNISGNVSVDKAKMLYRDDSDIICYCRQQSVEDLMKNEEHKDFCEDYLDSLARSSLLRIGVSTFIVFISFVLKIIIKYLSKFERYNSQSEKRKTLLAKMFFLSFFNTGLITLLLNSKIFDENEDFKGRYEEINREWYDQVGSTITVTMIINIFSQHAFQVLFFYPYGVCKRRFCYKRFKSQLKLNKFFRGPSFDISDSLSQILVVVCTNYFFSSGMPFLNVLCFLTLTLTYLCNKFLILRYYRKPPEYNHEINESVFLFLPLPIILHSIFGIYSFGSSEIFPDSVTKPAGSDYVKLNSNTIKDLLQKTFGITSMFLVIGMVVFIVFIKFKRSDFYERFWNYRVYAEKNLNNVEFRDLKAQEQLSGLDSYDIHNNPRYKNLIKALDSVAKIRKSNREDAGELASESDSEEFNEQEAEFSFQLENPGMPPCSSINDSSPGSSRGFLNLSCVRSTNTERGIRLTV